MDYESFEQIFRKYLEKMQIDLNVKQLHMFYTYMNELIEWNNKFNLTAIIDPNDIILKHFIDSLIIEKYITGKKLIDVGTGAGFPGIPIKIYKEQIEMTLLDSLNKRIGFLGNVIEKLEMENIEAIHARAEEVGKNSKYREKFDIVTSRAVAELSILSEYMLPLAKIGRHMRMYEGKKFGRSRKC